MTTQTETLTRLIREVRTCFNQLRTLSELLNADLGINASMRAIMESLSQNVPRTAPELAQERGTARQHVQRVINRLLDQDLVRIEENPDHKRSVLYLLTPKGEKVFTEIRKREADPMRSLSETFSQADINVAADVLLRMNHKLDHLIKQENSND